MPAHTANGLWIPPSTPMVWAGIRTADTTSIYRVFGRSGINNINSCEVYRYDRAPQPPPVRFRSISYCENRLFLHKGSRTRWLCSCRPRLTNVILFVTATRWFYVVFFLAGSRQLLGKAYHCTGQLYRRRRGSKQLGARSLQVHRESIPTADLSRSGPESTDLVPKHTEKVLTLCLSTPVLTRSGSESTPRKYWPYA